MFGYVLYSRFARLRYGQPPGNAPVLAPAVATQFPDLVDKPLTRSFDVLPIARSLAHSLVSTAFVLAAVVLLARRIDRPRLAPAVAIGYLSHLAGDVIYPLVWAGAASPGYLLWPLLDVPGRDAPGHLERTMDLLTGFPEVLSTPAGEVIFALELSLVGAAFALLVVDGRPGVRLLG